MRNEGGFIEEQRPGERGLTHLIEHLVFVSPTINAPNDLHHLTKIGLPLTFPAPSAGTTSWRETNYFVSTKTTRTADLDTLLRLFREVATDLTFRSDAVDDQRADVMREMAGRKPGNVIYADYIADVAPGSPTDVIDGQNSDDVPTASVETIRALYRRLYRPENMMVVIVGNVDPTTAKALITQR
ncbi:MAG: insulinase family protein, partial [Sphingomonas sp.]